MRASSGDPLAEKIRVTKKNLNVAKEVYFVASEALKILFTEPIVAFLGVFNGFAYGLMFLYLEVRSLKRVSDVCRVFSLSLQSTTE